MAKAKLNKADLLKKMGDHMLEHGVNTASLRPLAQAADTSDRMLIYHFGSKDALIAEVLQHLASEYAVLLDAALPVGHQLSCKAMLTQIVETLRQPNVQGYIRVWLDILSAAAHGNDAHQHTGHGVAQFFIDWLIARLPDDTENPTSTAMLMLALIEGAHALDSIGQTHIADQAIAAAFPDP